MQTVLTGKQYFEWEYADLCELDGEVIETDASVRGFEQEPVTSSLRNLVLRCMAIDPGKRPILRDLVGACEFVVYNWPATYFEDLPDGQAIYETDAVIRSYIQALVLDADYEVQQNRLRHGRRSSFVL